MKFAATALLLLAAVGAARAEQPYGPPATADAAVSIRISEEAREEEAAARALAERRHKMIEDCEQTLGSEIDCARETDTELGAESLQSGLRVIHVTPARP
jgi:hypothetical protein